MIGTDGLPIPEKPEDPQAVEELQARQSEPPANRCIDCNYILGFEDGRHLCRRCCPRIAEIRGATP